LAAAFEVALEARLGVAFFDGGLEAVWSEVPASELGFRAAFEVALGIRPMAAFFDGTLEAASSHVPASELGFRAAAEVGSEMLLEVAFFATALVAPATSSASEEPFAVRLGAAFFAEALAAGASLRRWPDGGQKKNVRLWHAFVLNKSAIFRGKIFSY
jgi:hypothetical protein